MEATLDKLVVTGSAAWPGLRLPAVTFVQHLAALLPEGEEAASWLKEIDAADLFLACACARGVPGAVAAFDSSLLCDLTAFLSGVDPGSALLDEVRQRLCEKLFVGSQDHPPRIAHYSGRGPLRTWVRVAAVAQDPPRRAR